MVLTRFIHNLPLLVTEVLQKIEIDVAYPSNLLDFLKGIILSKRNTIYKSHNNCYIIVLAITKMVIINETKPHTTFCAP